MPPHETFVESCAGGLSVLLNKPRSDYEVVGDLDGPLIRFWRMLQNRSQQLLRHSPALHVRLRVAVTDWLGQRVMRRATPVRVRCAAEMFPGSERH